MGGVVLEAAALTRAPRPVAGRSDHQLVSLVRAGDDRAFEELFHRYRRRITAYVSAWSPTTGARRTSHRRSSSRPCGGCARPSGRSPFGPGSTRSPRTRASTHTAGAAAPRRSPTSDEGQAAGTTAAWSRPPRRPTRRWRSTAARAPVRRLRRPVRGATTRSSSCASSRACSYREIGERMGLSRPAVESTLFRARRRLSEEYDELASGARCQRVQAIISSAVGGRSPRATPPHGSPRRPLRELPPPRAVAGRGHAAGAGERSPEARRAAPASAPARGRAARGRVGQDRGHAGHARGRRLQRRRRGAARRRDAAVARPRPRRGAPSSRPTSRARRWPRRSGSVRRTCACRGPRPRPRRTRARGRSGTITARRRRGGATGATAMRPAVRAAASPALGPAAAAELRTRARARRPRLRAASSTRRRSHPAPPPPELQRSGVGASTPAVSVPSAPEVPDVQTPSAPQVQVPQVQVPQVPDVHVDTPNLPDTSGATDAVPSVPSLP